MPHSLSKSLSALAAICVTGALLLASFSVPVSSAAAITLA